MSLIYYESCWNAPLSSLCMVALQPFSIMSVRVEFILFGLVLLGVAVCHHRTFEVAATGLVVITADQLKEEAEAANALFVIGRSFPLCFAVDPPLVAHVQEL